MTATNRVVVSPKGTDGGGSVPACLATPRKGRRKPSKGVDDVEKPKAKRIYSMPAFGYRNYEEEVEFLIGQYQALHEGKPPVRGTGPRVRCWTCQAFNSSFAIVKGGSYDSY